MKARQARRRVVQKSLGAVRPPNLYRSTVRILDVVATHDGFWF